MVIYLRLFPAESFRGVHDPFFLFSSFLSPSHLLITLDQVIVSLVFSRIFLELISLPNAGASLLFFSNVP